MQENGKKENAEYVEKRYYKNAECVEGNMFKRKIYDKMLEWKENLMAKQLC